MPKTNSSLQHMYPFMETPLDAFIYKGPQWDNTLQYLCNSVLRYKISLLLGIAGCGKTLLLKTLRNITFVHKKIYILKLAHLNSYSILCEIGNLIGAQRTWGSKQLLYNTIHDHISSQQSNVVIIIDDAHLLSSNVIIDITMLYNYLLDTNKLTLVLCGKHTLIDTLCLDKHQDFYARIRRRYYMPLFNDKETSDYIDFQLSTAKSNIAFADDVKEQIHHLSAGIVRNINNLCDACILQANELNSYLVDNDLLDDILENLKIRR